MGNGNPFYDENETLHEALASLGLTSRPSNIHCRRMILNEAGGSLGAYDCFEGFALVYRLRKLLARVDAVSVRSAQAA